MQVRIDREQSYMNTRHYPVHEDLVVAFDKEAYKKAVGYAEHYYPNEFNLVPVGGMILRNEKSPLRMLMLQDVAALVVHDYMCPPYQVTLGGHTSVQHGRRKQAGEIMTKQLDEIRAEYPRLSRNIKFHCHPFVGRGRFLSGGDISSNLVGKPLQDWKEVTSMSFVPMQVIWPFNRKDWNVTTFLYINQQVHVTPRPVYLAEDSRYRSVYDPCFWQGNTWLQDQQKELCRAYPGTTLLDIGRGWWRYYIPTEDKGIILAIPPDFPSTDVELHIVVRSKAGNQRAMFARNIKGEKFGEKLEDVDLRASVDKMLRNGMKL